MAHIIIKYVLSAAIVVAVSEIAKRNSLVGGLIASLPLVSLMGMIWLYQETRDTAKVAALSTSIFWLVLPSLVFFVIFPALLKRQVLFYPALGLSILAMLLSYGAMLFALSK
jgi:F0F1-type ATP synthase assembly protein I